MRDPVRRTAALRGCRAKPVSATALGPVREVSWVLFSIIVLRFNYTTVTAVSILFGFVIVT